MIVNQRRYSFGAVALGLRRRSVARMNVGWQRAKKNMLRGLRGVWLAVLQKVDFLVTGDCLGAEGGYLREVLPRAVVAELGTALRGQAGAIVAGLAPAAFAYARSRLGTGAEALSMHLFSRVGGRGA
jgi:hypothetical protein